MRLLTSWGGEESSPVNVASLPPGPREENSSEINDSFDRKNSSEINDSFGRKTLLGGPGQGEEKKSHRLVT